MHRVANLRLEAPSKQGDPYRAPLKASICRLWSHERDGQPIRIDTYGGEPTHEGQSSLWAPRNPNASPIHPWGWDGSLAGPKALEHVVDTVLYFEGERHHSHRVVRAVKNRFGAVSELGVFEMTGGGLRPVPNPSRMFLAERPAHAPGSAVLCSVEGSRPILVEVQALVSTSTYGSSRRMANGVDTQRLSLLLAVLEKRAGLNLIGDDVFVNMAGGMAIDEPATDLAVVAAIASSVRNRAIPPTTAMFGEVGLAGEVRGTAQAGLRIREAAQMGFERCVMPEANIDPEDRAAMKGTCELFGVRSIGEALDALLP